ncbi:DUF427 domain-containing protein [Gordonia sp. CPCC 206044]|uniref:DUF427 domain-containing protein n=1 Tax=Gordonia sp. CPCC 206044 TaxID=3140793 RepID=UPI003AF39FD6
MAISMDQLTMSALDRVRWCAMRRRLRAVVGGQTIVDTLDVVQVWEPYRVVGSYAVPIVDVHPPITDPVAVTPAAHHPPILTPDHPFSLHTCAGATWTIQSADGPLYAAGFAPDDPDLAGYIVLDFAAFDEWREEEQTVISHPHDPFKRIDCLPTSRHVVVSLDDVVLADTHRATLLLETHLPPRYYIPADDVDLDRLEPSDTITTCAYKGHATYWSARADDRTVADVAWTYRDPLNDAVPVRDLICFYDERVDLEVTVAVGPGGRGAG